MFMFQLCFIFVLSSCLLLVVDVVVAAPSTTPIVYPVSSPSNSRSSFPSSLPSFSPSSQPSLAPAGILARHRKTRLLRLFTDELDPPTTENEADRQIEKRKRRKMKVTKYKKRTGGKSSLRYKKPKGNGKQLNTSNGKSFKRTDKEGNETWTIVVSVSRNATQALQ